MTRFVRWSVPLADILADLRPAFLAGTAAVLCMSGVAFGQYPAPRTATGQSRPGYSAPRPATPPRPGGAATAPRAAAPVPRAATPAPEPAPAPPATVAEPASAARSAAAEKSAATPTVEEALKLAPIQPDIDYTKPAADEIARCKISVQKINGAVGWVVEDGQGLILRRFLDTNNDDRVDQWCYYKDGLEVYRDIDSDFNGKADQYRWFNTAGSRWALDKDEDGTIDRWIAISPEEVTAEVVAAIAKQDVERFQKVLLSSTELPTLGLGPARAKEVADKLAAAGAKFREAAAGGKLVAPGGKWLQFNGGQPGLVPAGTDGSQKDVAVYEHVAAFTESGSEHRQVLIGTLVKVGEGWRAIDGPAPMPEGNADVSTMGVFFRPRQGGEPRPQVTGNAPTEKSQQLLSVVEKLDAAINKATAPQELAELNGKRAEALEQLAADAAKPEERAMWIRQLADVVSAAVQSGTYPGGLAKLESLARQLGGNARNVDLLAYVKFRQISAEYAQALQVKGSDFAKVQTEWLKKLEQFVTDFAKSSEAAEGMLQLGLAQEFAGQDDAARKWYSQIVTDFPSAPQAAKAQGAKTRLDSVGKSIALSGKSPTGETVDLAKFRGQVVVIQYWSTTCEPCKADMATLRELYEKHGKSGLTVIGVNLDASPEAMKSFLAESPLPWPQIAEPGGLECRQAVDMGILTLPAMILVDAQGRVVNRNIGVAELSSEVKKLLR